MFHWICPECGCEIAPAVRECPVCDPSAGEGAAPASFAAPAAEPAALTPEIASPMPEQRRLREEPDPLTIDAEVEPVRQTKPPSPPEPGLAPLVRSDLAIAGWHGPARVFAATLVPGPAASPILPSGRALAFDASALTLPEEPGDPLLALIDAVHPGLIRSHALDLEHAAPRIPKPWTPPVRALEPVFAGSGSAVVAARAATPRGRRSLATLASAVDNASLRAPTAAAPRLRPRVEVLPELARPGSPARPEPAVPCASLSTGGLRNFTKTAAARFRPSPPDRRARGREATARISLPGPTLPHELSSLSAAGISTPLVPRPAPRPSTSMPGWAVSFVVALTLIAGGLGVAFYVMPGMLAGSPPGKEGKATPQVAAEPRPASYPLSKYVEVTGFRFITDPSRNPEIHYIVVNHSSALLSGVTVYVTLRTTGAEPGQPPLSQFSFPLPDLGPYESKEMVSPIQRITRAGILPEWQALSVQVDISQ